MIRRWSHIINFNYNLNKLKYSHIFFLYKTLKQTTIFKKFYFKKSKFNRKIFTKIKHRNNWLLYTQIFKQWVINFNNYKKYFKFQFTNKFFFFSFFVYDFNFLKLNKFKTKNFSYLNIFLMKNKFINNNTFFFNFKNIPFVIYNNFFYDKKSKENIFKNLLFLAFTNNNTSFFLKNKNDKIINLNYNFNKIFFLFYNFFLIKLSIWYKIFIFFYLKLNIFVFKFF